MSTLIRRFRVGALGALALSIVLCGAARADGLADGSAKEAYQRGAQAYAKHQYTTAASAFEEGYKLRPHPAFLFNLALTYRAMDKPQQAISYYERYLEALPNAPDRSQVELAIADEKRKLAPTEKGAPPAPAPSPSSSPSSGSASAALPAAAVAVAPSAGTGRDGGSSERTPIYRKWWFWAATGGAAVVAAVGIGLGVGLSQPGVAPYREVTWQ
jgi:tetratricopeptide (TPR) repeat protein